MTIKKVSSLISFLRRDLLWISRRGRIGNIFGQLFSNSVKSLIIPNVHGNLEFLVEKV